VQPVRAKGLPYCAAESPLASKPAELERERHWADEQLDEDDEEDEAARWVKEAEGPPSKPPPPQSPYYRVMPAPPEAEQPLDAAELLPSSPTTDAPATTAALAPAPHKAMPGRAGPKAAAPGAPPKSAVAVAALSPKQTAQPKEPGGAGKSQESPLPLPLPPPQREPPPQRALQGPSVPGASEPSPAKAAGSSEAPPRSRYKAPPLELAATRGCQAASSTSVATRAASSAGADTGNGSRDCEDAWGEWRGTSRKEAGGEQPGAADRMKATA